MRDPLAAIPIRPENVEMRRDSKGMVHLRLKPELRGLRKRIAVLLKYDLSRKVELDETGTFYYSLVDGVNTLHDIADRMTSKLGKSRKEVNEMVVVFTKKLMTMDALHLKVPAPAETGRPVVGKL